MNLKAYQQAWLAQLLNPAESQTLGPEARAALQGLSGENLATRVHQVRRQRLQALEAVLPPRIRQVLGYSHAQAMLASFAERGSLPPLYPPRRLLTELLAHCIDYLGRQQLLIPHLRDLIAYELAAAHLDFFNLPCPLPPTSGPRLATWARLIRLGSQFPALLEALNRGLETPDLPETPRPLFLLTREFRGLRLETVPPLVAACLELCDGQQSWPDLVETVLSQRGEPVSPTEADLLQSWNEHLLQRGVLLQSTGEKG